MTKIVFEGNTGKGKNILIRYPTHKDAKAMCDYINDLSGEQTFISFQGEKITFEDEVKYLNEQLEKIEEHKAVQLLVFCDSQLVGITEINMQDRASKHVGVLGISIAKELRGEGVGKLAMENLLKEAKVNIPQLKIVSLGVFANNPIAIKMYKEFGFQEYGLLTEGFKYRDKYVDSIYMYKKIR